MRKILKKIIGKFFLKSDNYFSNGYYHEKTFALYNNLESLCKLSDCNNKEPLKTKSPIFLNKNIEFGNNYAFIKRKMGKPTYKLYRSVSALGFTILIYKMYLGAYKTKQEVHLYENTLYYFNYIFSYLNNSDKEILRKLLCKKYLNEEQDLNNKVLIDKYNNKLFLSENVDFTIHYLTGNTNLLQEFTALKEVDKFNLEKLAKKNQDEILSKL